MSSTNVGAHSNINIDNINPAVNNDNRYQNGTKIQNPNSCSCSVIGCPPPFRIMIALLGVLACILLCSTRYNLSIAIVSMVEESCTPDSSLCYYEEHLLKDHPVHNIYRLLFYNSSFHPCDIGQSQERINWSEAQQGFSLGIYYYGFAATHVFGGRLAERLGPKWIAVLGLMGAAVINALLPIAAFKSFSVFLILRVLVGCFHGLVHPALFFMFRNWFPEKEQTVALSMLLIGNALGLIINVPLALIISKITTIPIPHWSLLFYFGSALHVIWLVLWIIFANNIPEHSPYIKDTEVCYIRQNARNVFETDIHTVPWRKILESKPLYASIIAKICWSFNHAIIIDNGPSYLNKVYGFQMLRGSMDVAVVYLATIIVFLLSAPLFSFIDQGPNKRKLVSHTQLRKIFQTLVFLGAAITMLVLPFVGCGYHILQTIILVNMITQGFTAVGEYPMINEFAGYYSGTVNGIAITFDSLARSIAPIIRGELVIKSLENWHIVFWISSALNAIGLIVFGFCASTTAQSWTLNREFVRQISTTGNGNIERPVKKELKVELQNPHFRQDINTETDEWREFKADTLVH